MGPNFDFAHVLDYRLLLYMEGAKVYWQGAKYKTEGFRLQIFIHTRTY